MSSCPPHIELGIVQQSKGHSALHRLAYQTCTYFNDGNRREDFTPFKRQHHGGLVLLPGGAPAEFADECRFVMAVAFREERADAQAGRTLDFALPRGIPRQLWLAAAAFVVAPFAEQGMATRLDVECPPASDGGINPHGHGYFSQRVLEADGFGNKYRPWNQLFLRNMGRHVRALIAGRITLASALVGVGAFVDPRRNKTSELPQPEERIPHQLWRKHERGIFVAPIEKLKAARQEKKAAKVVQPAGGAETGEGPRPVIVMNAVSRRQPMSVEQRSRPMNFVVPLVLEAGAEAFGSGSARDEIALLTRDGSMTFDGETFTTYGTVGAAQARLIVQLAQALDWPAMVVEGDARSADEIIVAGAPMGITAINRCASESAIRLIQSNYGHLLADTIRPLDPLSVAVNALEAAHFEPGEVEPRIDNFEAPENLELNSDIDLPESPKTSTTEDVCRDNSGDRTPVLQRNLNLDTEDNPDAAHSKRQPLTEITRSEPKQSYSEFVSDSNEFDIPEPSGPTVAEEELRRRSSAALWEGWVARNFEGLRWNPARAVRGHRAPPKPRESGPS
jgi:MobA/MobL family